jgi:hypothetical protein
VRVVEAIKVPVEAIRFVIKAVRGLVLLPMTALFAAHLPCPELSGLRWTTSFGINKTCWYLKH